MTNTENTLNMTQKPDDDRDELAEQLQISKEFLEYAHGSALRAKNPDEAYAYNDAIGLVDDALEQRWDTGTGTQWDEFDIEFIEESRKARENGHKAAVLHEQSLQESREKYHQPSLLDVILPWRSTSP